MKRFKGIKTEATDQNGSNRALNEQHSKTVIPLETTHENKGSNSGMRRYFSFFTNDFTTHIRPDSAVD
jgi:hypothetical protein